jgi:hypothetical protein
MALGQISEDFLSAMHSANVTVRVMFVDPWVDGLGAPMFELNLCKCGLGQGCVCVV